MSVKETPYQVIQVGGAFEIREYPPQLVAETVVEGSLEGAGNQAFGKLFGYISGANQSQQKVAMTAPVSQAAAGEKIAMTAPVTQQLVQEKWAVRFMMPAGYTLETAPTPTDPAVTLRLVPACRMAAVRYSGSWSEEAYRQHQAELESWIRTCGLVMVGDPVWARYNPPFMPSFLRRNEILIPVANNATAAGTGAQ